MNAPVVEPTIIIDTFCTELVKVEHLGPCTRLTFAVAESTDSNECGTQNVVVAKLVIATELVNALFRGEQLKIAPAARRDEAEVPQTLN